MKRHRLAPDDNRSRPARPVDPSRQRSRQQRRESERRAVLTPDDDRMLLPRVAAVELEPEFRTLARQLAPRDKSTQDDLVQEMALACLLATEAQSRSSFRLCAVWRAKDYLRWWRKERATDLAGKNAEPEEKLVDARLEKACAALNRLLGVTAYDLDAPSPVMA